MVVIAPSESVREQSAHYPSPRGNATSRVFLQVRATTNIEFMPTMRIRQAAELLGVSDDTIRRWIDNGALTAGHDDSGRKVIAGDELAEFWRNNSRPLPPDPLGTASSARNRFIGLVTDVISDKVMTHVEMQCGPHTVVSLMSTQAAQELKLEPGRLAVAIIKATTVIVERPRAPEGLAEK